MGQNVLDAGDGAGLMVDHVNHLAGTVLRGDIVPNVDLRGCCQGLSLEFRSRNGRGGVVGGDVFVDGVSGVGDYVVPWEQGA